MTDSRESAVTIRKLALYGGAFDPVHNAHLELARCVRSSVPALDGLVFIPSARSPLESHAPLASDTDRLQMLELALGGDSFISVDTFETDRKGMSFSIDTVAHFRSLYPEATLFWIIGADQYEQLAKWHQIEKLAQLVTFLVFARPGYVLGPQSIEGLELIRIEAPLMSESSTEVRRRLLSGAPVSDMLPAVVEAFISEKGLYKN